MKDGRITFGQYTIEPKSRSKGLLEADFRVINTSRQCIYLSKNAMEIKKTKFWVGVYFEADEVKKVELRNASKKYKMDYSSMKWNKVEKLRKEHDRFLASILGAPHVRTMAANEYFYSWGKIVSFYDNRSGECGIVILYT